MKNTETEAATRGLKADCGAQSKLRRSSPISDALRRGRPRHRVGRRDSVEISVSALADADGPTVEADVPVPDGAPGATEKAYELVVKPSDYPELEKVGGFVTLETKVGKIVVARVSETEFSAVGAVCTHKGGPIEYNADDKQFFCPWHKSKFDLDGAVIKGPAKIALPGYKEETAAVIKLK